MKLTYHTSKLLTVTSSLHRQSEAGVKRKLVVQAQTQIPATAHSSVNQEGDRSITKNIYWQSLSVMSMTAFHFIQRQALCTCVCSCGCVPTYILLYISVHPFVLTPICLCLIVLYIEIYALFLDLRNIYTCVSLAVNIYGSKKHLNVYIIFQIYI